MKKELYIALRDKWEFRPDLELVPEGALCAIEIEAEVMRKFYEGE